MTTETLLSDSPTSTQVAVDQAAQTGNAGTPVAQADATQQTPAAAPEGDAGGSEATPEKVVPEKYEFKTPEGEALEGAFLGEFEGIARELGLSQEQANKVAELGVKMSKDFGVQQEQAMASASEQWQASVTADKEIGGDKLPENLAIAKKALADFGTPELSELLEKSKLGNHPEVVRFMVRAGKAISQDSKVVTGGANRTAYETAATRMYPNMNP